MKKTFLFLLLAATSAPAVFAQTGSTKAYTRGSSDSRNTGFGVKGGYNLNGLRGDDIRGIDRKARNDFHAGFFGQFGLNNFSSIQAELLYSRQGFEANTGVTGSKQKYRMDYLQLPIMYVGNVTNNISFHVGPQVSLLTNIKREDKSLDIKENGFNSFDYGGVAGLEARVGPARIGARYNLSLGKIFEAGPSTTGLVASQFGNSRIYNNLLQVYVGFGFSQ